MRIHLLFIFLLFYSGTALFAQSTIDSTNEKLERVFQTEEVKPSFKGGDEALNQYLNKNVNPGQPDDGDEATVIFIVSAKGNIYEVKELSGNLGFEKSLTKALLKSSGLWNSGLQNDHHISAYCKLKITYRNEKIWAEIQ